MNSVPSTILASILASHSASASTSDLQSALSFLKTSIQSTSTTFPPFKLDEDPLPTLLTRRRIATIIEPVEEQTSLEWLHSSLKPLMVASVLEILRSPSSDQDILESLLEIWGFEGIEQVSLAIERRGDIIREAESFSGEFERTEGDGNVEMRRNYTPSAQISFQTSEDLERSKRARKNHRNGKGKLREDDDGEIDLEEWKRIRDEQLAIGPGPLWTGKKARVEEQEKYPHVYLSSASTASSGFAMTGQRVALPVGTMRSDKGEYEEITIPAPAAVPFRTTEELMPIEDMDIWGQRTFHAYKTLNRLQSIVFPVAYNTNENMLVCAPTGAGKTDVALLAILRCLSSLTTTPLTSSTAMPTLPPASTYKIIYVAPLKALAAEITLKFSKRLGWAGVKVKEFTGDMKLTKKEVDETGVIVTTPEKWDVVTRKGAGGGDSEVAEKVKLLIIDEVHLLHEDRGAVIESIVARTLRQVESSQNLIRIVGLSATLPNYVDVADFLRVNRYQGLFYFDASFRPVPLEQHFIGVKGKAGSQASRGALDNACFDKVAELVKAGHQVMVFVHARKDTVKTAQTLREKAAMEGILELLDPNENERYSGFKRDMSSSRNREMKELSGVGFGIHHAGMLRSDRTLSERMFEANVTKVLCCTATLAWGVNLPAYAVVIKGTQIYDSGKGQFVDLGILDVLQIFGRAGRPQYESQGVGYICTTADKLDHYVSAITQQHPIESKFIEGLVDSINAEISLGTVTNMDEGVRWLGYSYLFVRMRKNPLIYGMVASDVEQDPLLGSKRHSLITISAKRLAEVGMIQFDPDLGTLIPTELGRIASRYYIRNASIEIFNKIFRPLMSEADVLGLIASSVEFNQITVRENEVEELAKLIENVCPCQVKGGTDTSAGKVNVLLQAYISKAYVEDFALISDMGYVAQNAGRIVRALLEIAMSKKWAPVTLSLMAMSKAIEKRMWPFGHPLVQFDLPADLMYNIERWVDELSLNEIGAMTDAEFGAACHQNERLGGFATRAARQMPSLSISHTLQPLTHDLLRVRLELRRSFEWSEKYHGSTEAFWVWIEDEDNLSILQMSRVLVRDSTTVIYQDFVIPLITVPSALHIRVVSDRWMGAEDVHLVALDELVMPTPPPPHRPLLDLPLLSAQDAFNERALKQLYVAENPTFDPVQTQAFHSIYHTANNVLVCAPSAPSRGTLLELAIWRAFDRNPNARILFLTPRKALARHVSVRIRKTFSRILGIPTMLLSRHQDLNNIPNEESGFIGVGSASPLLGHLIDDPELFSSLDLIIAHDLHALDPAYELLIARLRWSHPSARMVGSSACLLDASDLATWLGVLPRFTYSFSPATRSSSLITSFQSFTTPHSMNLLRSMIKPAYAAMRLASGSTICFVPSRAQCRSTANDLVTQTASDLDESFLVGSNEMIENYARTISDEGIAEALTHGIAVYHEGLSVAEQELAIHLFKSGVVRILIVSREACWTLPVTASLVIVLSAQYAIIREDKERQIVDYSLPELLQMQSLAQCDSDSSAECLILCQTEQSELYGRFLSQGLPLESELVFDEKLVETIYNDLGSGMIKKRQDLLEWFSWTYFANRIKSNPSYYQQPTNQETSINQDSSNLVENQLSRLVDTTLLKLQGLGLILMEGNTEFKFTLLGKLFNHRGLTIEDITRLKSSDLDRLVTLTVTEESKSLTEIAIATLKNFYSRLPRGMKDKAGLVGLNEDAEEEEKAEFRKRVLLVAFTEGRIPRDLVLEREQAFLVKSLLDATGV